jgi:hypothetical protein
MERTSSGSVGPRKTAVPAPSVYHCLMSDAALRVRAFLMTLSEEDRAWLADELAASLAEPQRRGAGSAGGAADPTGLGESTGSRPGPSPGPRKAGPESDDS